MSYTVISSYFFTVWNYILYGLSYILSFPYVLLVFGLFAGILAIFALFYFKSTRLPKLEKLPRNVILGVIFAVIDIVWCVPQALAIFSAGSAAWIFPAAIICLVVGCFFLDYLFARALAGFLILLCHYFLLESFAADLQYLWVFSLAFYVMGTFGIVMGALPYLLKNLIRNISFKISWKVSFTIIFAFYSLLGIITGIVLL